MRYRLLAAGMLVLLFACDSDVGEQPPLAPIETAPHTAPVATSSSVAPSTPTPTAKEPAPPNLIFFNGQVVTMEPDLRLAQALALRGDVIVAVGSDDEVIALRGPETQLIDLGGRALLPGFVDTHVHPFAVERAISADSLDGGQQWLLAGGTTTVGETAVNPEKLDQILLALESTNLRIRTSLYLTYNTKCKGLQPEDWYLDYPPLRDPTEMLRIPGIKIFGDAAGPLPLQSCGWAAMSTLLPPQLVEAVGSGPYGDLLLSEEELAQVIAEHQALGYQVIIHARGDVVVETALNAIESALAGQPNTFRHRIEHNDFIRPDLLTRYGELGVLPTIRGQPAACLMNRFDGSHWLGEEVNPWFQVARSLLDANPDLPVAWHSDAGHTGRRPINELYDFVTRRQINPDDGSVCEPPKWLAAEAVSVEEALRLMTINAAYALFMEDKVGSIKPGKFADLIILSENPLAVDPDEIVNIEVVMTMVGGKVEHCLEGHETLCAFDD